MSTPNYGWDHVSPNQASKEVTVNGVFDAIDAQVKANTAGSFASSGKRQTIIATDGTATALESTNHVGDTLIAAGTTWSTHDASGSSAGDSTAKKNASADTYAGWYGTVGYRTGRHINGRFGAYVGRTTDSRTWIGFHSAPASLGVSDNPTGNYAMFRFSSIGGDTHWQCITKDGTTQTIVDSGITPDTNEHRFGIEFDDVNAAVKFYIDGVLVATITTHLPSAGTNLILTALSAWHTAVANPGIGAGHFLVESDS